MREVGETIKNGDDLFHLARVALNGRPQDLHVLIRKLARRYRATDKKLASELTELLRKSPVRGSPTRRAESVGLPLDSDSRLPLLRLADVPVLDLEPVYDDSTWSALHQIVSEQQGIEQLNQAGVDPTRTVLLTGPPGVGKTFAAKWIARELGRPLATLDLSAVMSSFLGRTGSNVRGVLDYAKEHDCVLLLDELDAVAKRRDDATEIGELKRLVTVLLQEVDEWPSNGLLIAATNHPGLLDPAVWRRFELIVDFPLPIRDHLAVVCHELIDADDASPWPNILGIALEGCSFSDAVQSVRRARRRAALNGGELESALMQLVRDKTTDLNRSEKQAIAIALIDHAKLSQRQASELTGVSRDTIRKHARTAMRD